jgi:2-polyprenyl-3-methyl-5-hydroxy-6-metoxy-1,4-benzoquinol methylase
MRFVSNCLICGNSQNVKYLAPYKGNHSLFQNLQILRCSACGIEFADPMLDDKILNEYNSSYYQNAHGGFQDSPLALGFQSAINKNRALHVFAYLKQQMIQVEEVFEIGPGSGMFLKHFKNLSKTKNYSILEADLIERKNLQPFVTHSFVDLEQVPKSKYDLVVCSHVLEHTNDPLTFIRKLKSLLKIGGVLFIEVPCQDYLYKEIHEPHLFFFNKVSLESVIKKNNFVKLETTYFGPGIYESFLYRIIRDAKVRFWSLMYHRLPGLCNQIFKNHLKIFTVEECIGIEPYDFLLEKDSPSWWLRMLAVKEE